MRNLIATIAVLALIQTAAAADWRDGFGAYIEGENSKTIVDALWSAPGSFWVSVRDDGSSRDGFAEYVCMEMGFRGMTDGTVVIRIWDAYAMARDEMTEIGRHVCAR